MPMLPAVLALPRGGVDHQLRRLAEVPRAFGGLGHRALVSFRTLRFATRLSRAMMRAIVDFPTPIGPRISTALAVGLTTNSKICSRKRCARTLRPGSTRSRNALIAGSDGGVEGARMSAEFDTGFRSQLNTIARATSVPVR
jgi:hypothetical protein